MDIKIESPEQFFKLIPTTIQENLEFRRDFNKLLCKDPGLRKVFLELAYIYPPIFYNAMFWTFNPKQPPGYRNCPFILRPAQIDVVMSLKDAIDNHHDLLIDKSRDEGATELITKFFALYWLLFPSTMFLVGSRNEAYVDRAVHVRGEDSVSGDHKCLFHKILYGIVTLPPWLRPKLLKTHLHLENLDNGSIIDGETTTENFGAGDRRTAVLLDEFGRVDHATAQRIRESVSDVSDTVIYNSTHFYGKGHPFAKLRFSGKIKVVTLPWHRNPEKNVGLYRSPDLNVVKILDLDYYCMRYPRIFKENISIYKASDVQKLMREYYPDEKLTFVADGTDKLRSIWYDEQASRRDARDMAVNVDMNPSGSGDMFFDAEVCQRLRNEKVRPPAFEGEVVYKLDSEGRVYGYKFVKNAGLRRFKWWGNLPDGRPDQSHNYIVSCDISMGNGASNSVIGVYDVNTYEKVGIFVCPNTPPETLADQAVAIGKWAGGRTGQAYMIWEANGPGNAFGQRIRKHNYKFVYRARNERTISRKRTNKLGWYSTGGVNGTKYDLLVNLRMALAEGLKTNPTHKALIVYDEATVSEYEDYIFFENGTVGLSSSADESSGARSAHGDRVIADGMAVLAMQEQPKAAVNLLPTLTYDSYAYRQRKRRQDEEEENYRYLY